MLDSKALASIPLIPANTAPPAPDYPWPRPYTSAMFLSFDVDAETAWTSKDALHAQRLITMSYGGYEARVGTPKLLELLDQLDLKATFFVTGWSVDAHPAMAEAILKAGHEIGHHGYHHLLPDPGDPWIEEELERGFEVLKRRLGVKPTGYRAPYGEFTEELRVATGIPVLYNESLGSVSDAYVYDRVENRDVPEEQRKARPWEKPKSKAKRSA